jgi:hypothetical protein
VDILFAGSELLEAGFDGAAVGVAQTMMSLTSRLVTAYSMALAVAW